MKNGGGTCLSRATRATPTSRHPCATAEVTKVVLSERQRRIFDVDRVTAMRVCHCRCKTNCGCQLRRPPCEGRHPGGFRE
eukprot:4328052-Pyramimonas_sp.AAC.1